MGGRGGDGTFAVNCACFTRASAVPSPCFQEEMMKNDENLLQAGHVARQSPRVFTDLVVMSL